MVRGERRCANHNKEIKSQETDIRYTQKQIDKYQRQKYISELEKTSKNLFKMLRNKGTSASEFLEKFTELKEKLSEYENIPLDIEHYKELEAYVNRLYDQINSNEFSDEYLDDIREAEMSNLNRLQKMKNSKSYKKTKHKRKEEDWG